MVCALIEPGPQSRLRSTWICVSLVFLETVAVLGEPSTCIRVMREPLAIMDLSASHYGFTRVQLRLYVLAHTLDSAACSQILGAP